VQRLPLLADKERPAGRFHPGAFFQPCADGALTHRCEAAASSIARPSIERHATRGFPRPPDRASSGRLPRRAGRGGTSKEKATVAGLVC
jgi:hypothetical protein